jgi:tyrosine-protein phosphatase YwqE
VHVLASDSHDTRGRPPRLREAVEALAKRVGEELAHRMVGDIPRALLRGEEVELPEADPPARTRSVLGRWFRR